MTTRSFSNGLNPLNDEQKKELLRVARTTIEEYIRHGKKHEVKEADPRLMERGEGAFVTLHKPDHRLRGCIGRIVAAESLCYLVRDMAIASATQDPRFRPVQADELDGLDVEVSVLSKPRLIKNTDEIQLGVHGVIISKSPYYHGVFLPQVATETGWSKEEFLSQLCSQKAGLSADCWKNDPQVKMEIFTADVFAEKELK